MKKHRKRHDETKKKYKMAIVYVHYRTIVIFFLFSALSFQFFLSCPRLPDIRCCSVCDLFRECYRCRFRGFCWSVRLFLLQFSLLWCKCCSTLNFSWLTEQSIQASNFMVLFNIFSFVQVFFHTFSFLFWFDLYNIQTFTSWKRKIYTHTI